MKNPTSPIKSFIDSFGLEHTLLYRESTYYYESWDISIGGELEQLSTAAEQKANDAQFSFVIPHYSIPGGGWHGSY